MGLRVCLKFGDPAALGRRLGFTDNPGCARAPGLHVSRYARTADRERRCRYCSITGATPSMRRGCPAQTFPGAPGVPPLDGRALRWCQSPWAAAAPGAVLRRVPGPEPGNPLRHPLRPLMCRSSVPQHPLCRLSDAGSVAGLSATTRSDARSCAGSVCASVTC